MTADYKLLIRHLRIGFPVIGPTTLLAQKDGTKT